MPVPVLGMVSWNGGCALDEAQKDIPEGFLRSIEDHDENVRKPKHIAEWDSVQSSDGASIGRAKPTLTRSMMTIVLKPLISEFS